VLIIRLQCGYAPRTMRRPAIADCSNYALHKESRLNCEKTSNGGYRVPARGSGRQHKAWGGAQRNPRVDSPKIMPARGAGDSVYRDFWALARSAGCGSSLQFLGFRCAAPQALCCRPLPRAGFDFPPTSQRLAKRRIRQRVVLTVFEHQNSLRLFGKELALGPCISGARSGSNHRGFQGHRVLRRAVLWAQCAYSSQTRS